MGVASKAAANGLAQRRLAATPVAGESAASRSACPAATDGGYGKVAAARTARKPENKGVPPETSLSSTSLS